MGQRTFKRMLRDAPNSVEGHRFVALVEEQPVPGPGCSSANTMAYDPVGHGYALGDPKSPDAGRWA